jgi:hypothetical protein
MVIEGGDVTQIAQTILNKKTPGTDTYGTTTETVNDRYGNPNDISFYVLANTTIYLDITLHALNGYLSTTADLVKSALAYYVSNLSVGEDILYNKLWAPANLEGSAALAATGSTQAQLDVFGSTFDVTALTIGTSPSPVGVIDVPIAFNHAAQLLVVNITVTVT